MMNTKTSPIGVIGAGTIGIGVALDLAIHGYQVLLKDLANDVLESARAHISTSYRFTKMMRKSDPIPGLDAVMANISFQSDYGGFEEAGVVIENITEDFDAKKRLYSELREKCRPEVIYGVNTSCISITKIGALMPQPENVIGMHFMNPVPLSKMVEVIRGVHTADATVEWARRFISGLDKTPVVVNDAPGFVTNRVLMLTINECIWLVHDQVADPKSIDTIFKLGFGHKMGPLSTGDLIGLDTILNSLLILYESYNDPKYRPCPLLRKMVDAGQLGKKSGKGFFSY